MLTNLQKEELEKIKPPKYREKVQTHLAANGHQFSLETIQKVYSGKRNNLTITKAIVLVFSNYIKEKQLIDSQINNIMGEITKKKS